MNLVILRGNIARDPELRYVNTSGRETAVINFTVAVSREFTKNNGEQDKVTTFVNCEAWDTGAEAIGNSFRKGDLVMIEGSLRNDSWEKDGIKRSTMKVRVNNFARIQKISKSSGANKKDSQETSQDSSGEPAVAF
jgi:single-strand DNA-binding protein|tara:strand:+ start:10802 stop:11209 length:408 start_codon:yes stop_codon:yes gene_type:complete